MIADELPIPDVYALIRTSWAAENLLTRYMYRRAKDGQTRSGVSFFFEAVGHGNLVAAKEFIDLGVSVNKRELMCNEDDRHKGVEEFEIDNVTPTYIIGYMPLHLAIIGGYSDDSMVRLLIDAGADIFAPCQQFVSPLHMAAWLGSTSIIELLLSRGADPNTMDLGGSTLLHDMTRRGATDIVQLLLGVGADVEAKDSLGRTALHCAAMFGDAECVRALLQSGANVMATDSLGNTPLLLAVGYRGSKASALCLLHLGRSYPDSLHQAQINAAQALFSAGRDKLQTDAVEMGNNIDPLVNSENQSDRIIELLLAAGADIGAGNEQHYSAFLWAVFNANYNDLEDVD